MWRGWGGEIWCAGLVDRFSEAGCVERFGVQVGICLLDETMMF